MMNVLRRVGVIDLTLHAKCITTQAVIVPRLLRAEGINVREQVYWNDFAETKYRKNTPALSSHEFVE